MTTRITGVLLAVILSAAAVLIYARSPRHETRGLTVHEWGTFTSVAGEDGSAINWAVLGGKDDLPTFVNDRGYRGFKFTLTGTVRMETPVLYFYAPREMNADVKVSFPKGLITEWYPKAEYQVDQTTGPATAFHRLPPNLNGIDLSLLTVIGGIEWKQIKVQPGASPDLPRETNASRYYAARATDASPVTVDGQQEKFLFYRGVGRFAVPLSARLLNNGKVVLANCGTEIPTAIYFEHRGAQLGYRIAAGIDAQTTLDPPSLGAASPDLVQELENALVQRGLFRKEAQAMLATWRDSWFEEGSRVIYLLPQKTVDAVLPLQVDPVPSQITRVFVGRIELITPDTIRSVEAALDANDPCVFDRYGRFLDPILKRIASEAPARASQIQRFGATARTKGPAACSSSSTRSLQQSPHTAG